MVDNGSHRRVKMSSNKSTERTMVYQLTKVLAYERDRDIVKMDFDVKKKTETADGVVVALDETTSSPTSVSGEPQTRRHHYCEHRARSEFCDRYVIGSIHAGASASASQRPPLCIDPTLRSSERSRLYHRPHPAQLQSGEKLIIV